MPDYATSIAVTFGAGAFTGFVLGVLSMLRRVTALEDELFRARKGFRKWIKRER